MFSDTYQNITNIVVLDGATAIQQDCFQGCQALRTIKLPSSISSIGEKAFENCTSLESVRFLGDAPSVDGSIYFGTPRTLVTYVAEGSKGWNGGTSETLPEAWPIGDSTARTIAYWAGPDETVTSIPVITPSDGALFLEQCEVSISCMTEGATIYYTTNGTTPRISARYAYTGPFIIGDSITVKAIAVAEGLERSEYVTATIMKVDALTMPFVLGAPIGVSVETGGDAEWTPTGDTSSPERGVAAKSGNIGELGETWLEAVVNGAGTFSFWWRVSCEKDDAGTATWDHLLCEADGEEIARIDGVTKWERHEIVFVEATNHIIRWTYEKDDYDEEDVDYEDCAWITRLEWEPTAVTVPSTVTEGHPVTIEKAWADRYPLFEDIYGMDFAAAITQTTDKVSSDGEPMAVWQDYVAGTDPTNPNDLLRAVIAMSNDVPIVTWTPNLNTNGEVRVYTVLGKTNLTDAAWVCPTNAAHRFFRVKVEMP
jgi:hypothetical protein